MLAAVQGIGGFGLLDVLSHDECRHITQRVLGLRERWTDRSGRRAFFTLGVNAYIDLASSTDPESSYFGPARDSNALLLEYFRDVLETCAEQLGRAMGQPTRLADDLAYPGFHIWAGQGIPRSGSTSTHFDLQYQRVLAMPAYERAAGVLSFTLPIQVPTGGTGLQVWPGVRYPGGSAAAADCEEPVTVPYRVGQAVVHTGHVWHRVGPSPRAGPDDLRLTLQGHGLVVDDEVVLYW